MAELNEILGNERIKEHFITAVRHKKISHAYIMEGDKGSGKKLLADAFAKILQCEGREASGSVETCGRCESCIQMEHHDHPDVIWVSHEKPNVISVGEIREQIVNTVDIMPYKGPYKIYIVDEAEKMNAAAQNAILKTIEEPPEYAVIFLLTTNRGAFLDTILSRCILLATRPVPGASVEKYLMEKCSVSKEEAEFAAGFSLGNIGKAEAIVSSEEFRDLKNLTLSILRYIHEIESYEIADKVKEYKKYKNRIDDFFDIFLMWFRDIMLLKADNSVNTETAQKKIIFKNEYAYLKKQVDKLDLEAIDYVIERISRARMRIRSNVNFDATLELLIVEARREFKD